MLLQPSNIQRGHVRKREQDFTRSCSNRTRGFDVKEGRFRLGIWKKLHSEGGETLEQGSCGS